jgi:small subunit ribosomal protein S14
MVKKSLILRNKSRIFLINKYEKKRNILLYEFRKEMNVKLKLKIHSKIQQLPRNSSKVRLRNRCWKTGRARGYYRDFSVSRHVLREMSHQCLIPGITKSSW